jgi:hypothetical protein
MNKNEKHLRSRTNPTVLAAVDKNAATGVRTESVTAGENQ